MRYTAECAKAILLFAQDNTENQYSQLPLEDYENNLTSYSKNELVEHLRYLGEQGLFHRVAIDDFGIVGVTTGLTSKGQEVAEAMRNDTIWRNVLDNSKGALPLALKFILAAFDKLQQD